ncbi:MAG: terminase [Planctomycetes bacterium]|nr:terminase [Planctomycetota bacterium]
MRKFLDALAVEGNVSAACRASGASRTRAYKRRNRDSKFKAAWERHVEDFADRLEAEATRRAVDGWDEPVFYQGKRTGSVRKYSDRMLELMLKATRPQKFRESLADAIAGRTSREMAAQIRDAMRAATATVPGPPAAEPQPDSKSIETGPD